MISSKLSVPGGNDASVAAAMAALATASALTGRTKRPPMIGKSTIVFGPRARSLSKGPNTDPNGRVIELEITLKETMHTKAGIPTGTSINI